MTNSLRTWKWPIESSLIDLLKMVIFQFAVLVYQGGLPEGKLIFQGNPIQNVHRKNGEANGMEWGGFSAIILEIFGHWTSHKWVAERCHPWVVDHFSHVQMNRPFWNRCKAFDLLWIIQLIIDPSISILTNIRIVTSFTRWFCFWQSNFAPRTQPRKPINVINLGVRACAASAQGWGAPSGANGVASEH